MARLNGCFAKDGEEIDGKEFECATMEELADIFTEARKNGLQAHLNYFDDCDDLDLWITVE
jgi:hypothetical protein